MAHLEQTLPGLRAGRGEAAALDYRLSVSIASRKTGRSAVAMAAYRAGEKLRDERTGSLHNFTRKRGVVLAEIILPAAAPEWAKDRATLWSRSEQAEKRNDALIVREIQISLPHEPTDAERKELALGFARYLAERYGLAVDCAIHEPEGDGLNHHAHLLLATRPFANTKSGFGNKDRRLDPIAQQRSGQATEVETLRREWAQRLNAGNEKHGGRVDHRSYARRGINREATVKVGLAAAAMARRGLPTERGRINAAIRRRNAFRAAKSAKWELQHNEQNREGMNLARPAQRSGGAMDKLTLRVCP